MNLLHRITVSPAMEPGRARTATAAVAVVAAAVTAVAAVTAALAAAPAVAVAPADSAGVRSSNAAATPAAKPQTRRASAGDAARPGPARPASPGRAAGARRLEDVHIEGEISVPQVLFITASDQRRILDFRHRRWLRTSAALGAATPLPDRITVNPDTANDPRKEPSR
jgi:hypothetical protein